MLDAGPVFTSQFNLLTLSQIFIGYSGGVDSHVLLHMCAAIPEIKHKITVVYVHHGLQPEADAWAQHCRHIAQALGVKFSLLRVNASPKPGESPEEAARNARYAALKPLIGVDCALLVAQHREDQLETVLLQLFRGGGLRGLSGMPVAMAFGEGVLLRPLLDMARQDIVEYANTHRLHWVEDPSNAVCDYDRNFLRNDILPLLKQRWPALDKTVARSAAHCANAEDMIGQIARQWFLSVVDFEDNTVDISKLQKFDNHNQQQIIRAWFSHMALKLPAQAFVQRVLQEVMAARQDSHPVLVGQGISIRRYRHKLYCIKLTRQVDYTEIAWPKDKNSIVIPPDRVIVCVPASDGIAIEYWQGAEVVIKFRAGGEKMALPNRQGRHSLKNLFQEAGILPWQRDAVPLVYLDGKLAAVGEFWISADFYRTNTAALKIELHAISSN